MTRDHSKLICDIGELSAIITDAADLDGLLQRIVVTVAAHMEADVCSVYLHDEEKNELVLRATKGLLPSSVGQVRLRPGEGLTGLAFQRREAVCEGDAASHPNFRFFPGIGEESYRSFAAVPILRGRRGIGVLTLQSRQPEHFSPEDVNAFRTITAQLVTTIEMARLLLTMEVPVRRPRPPAVLSELKLVHGRVGAEGCALGLTVQVKAPSLADLRAGQSPRPLDLTDFRRAVQATEKELEALESSAVERLSEITSIIFSAQLLMLRDNVWLNAMEALIGNGLPPAEAVHQVVLEYVARFERMENSYFREKRYDVLDVGLRLLRNLLGQQEGASGLQGRIAIARELLPSEALKLGLQKVGGIVLLSGGVTSHVAVLARSLDLPLLIVDDPHLLDLPDGTRAVLDGNQGNLFLEPDTNVEQKFREKEEARLAALRVRDTLLDQTHTRDGTRVHLLANINLMADVAVARTYKAEGVGLYRSEFPFMIRNDFPSEEEQLRVYRRLVEGMRGLETTFRTLDIGGDKMLSYFDYGAQANPFLGLRSIRFSLRHRDVFLQQLRAMLRAAHDAEIRIMFPMISSVDEFASAADAVAECQTALAKEKIPACPKVHLGMMLELPSVLELMPELCKRAEFFSIGTNDFIQYMLAVDRTNETVADLYLPHHPAVLRGLARAVEAPLRLGRDVSVCGDMAHDARFVPFLLGIGVRKFSLDARYLPRIQETIAATDLGQARDLTARLLGETTVAGTAKLLGI
jgi:phosphotransferase system, enzyme I, PtsP